MSLLGWGALAGVLVVAAVLKSEWGREPRKEEESTVVPRQSAPVNATSEGRSRGRVPPPSASPRPRASASNAALPWAGLQRALLRGLGGVVLRRSAGRRARALGLFVVAGAAIALGLVVGRRGER
jgi:hypothetical protein